MYKELYSKLLPATPTWDTLENEEAYTTPSKSCQQP